MLVVIVIISIVAMIGLPYLLDTLMYSRDAARKGALQNISANLEKYAYNHWAYPLPDNYVIIKDSSGNEIAYQWKFGTGVSADVKMVWETPRDPSNWMYYTYIVSANQKQYWLLALLEMKHQEEISYNFVTPVYADELDFSNRTPYMIWTLGVLLNDKKVPIEKELSSGSVLTLDTNNTNQYKLVYKENTEILAASDINTEKLWVDETIWTLMTVLPTTLPSWGWGGGWWWEWGSNWWNNSWGGGGWGSDTCPDPNINWLTKYDDPYLGCYYVADNNVIQCTDSSITDDNIKQKCIDKKANKEQLTNKYCWFY